MIHNLVWRVCAIIAVSSLINITIIDGFLSNLTQIDSTSDPNFGHFNWRYKMHALLSFCFILIQFYLLYFLSFESFLKMNSEGNNNKVRLVFFKILPGMFMCYAVFVFVVLCLSRKMYVPDKGLFHLAPVSFAQKKQQPAEGLSTDLIKKTLSTFLKSNANKLPLFNPMNGNTRAKKDFASLPWKLLQLDNSQSYELQFKYLKFLFFTAFALFIYTILSLRLNICRKKQ